MIQPDEPTTMLTFRVHSWRGSSYVSTGLAVIRADNLASWLDYWRENRFSVERVLD